MFPNTWNRLKNPKNWTYGQVLFELISLLPSQQNPLLLAHHRPTRLPMQQHPTFLPFYDHRSVVRPAPNFLKNEPSDAQKSYIRRYLHRSHRFTHTPLPLRLHFNEFRQIFPKIFVPKKSKNRPKSTKKQNFRAYLSLSGPKEFLTGGRSSIWSDFGSCCPGRGEPFCGIWRWTKARLCVCASMLPLPGSCWPFRTWLTSSGCSKWLLCRRPFLGFWGWLYVFCFFVRFLYIIGWFEACFGGLDSF